MAKKIIIAILSVVLVGALAFLITWGVINFNKVQKGLEGTALYTKEDVDSAYRDGYDTAQFDKSTIEKQIAELRVELTEKQAQLDELTLTVNELNSENSELSEEVKNLKKEVENLNITIDSYEEFVKEVEESNKVIATFMIDGAVYKLQSYNPGDTISIETPEETNEYIFNAWTINGESVNVNEYVINESVTFTANITGKHKITFISNGEVYAEYYVTDDTTYTQPENPVAEYGYEFKGWSLDGETVVPVQTFPADDITYYAVYEKTIIEIEVMLYDYIRFDTLYGSNLTVGTISNISDGEKLEVGTIVTYEGITGEVVQIYLEGATAFSEERWKVRIKWDIEFSDSDTSTMIENLCSGTETITIQTTIIQ